jgi:tetraacyldisaccharide 4'-kinase
MRASWIWETESTPGRRLALAPLAAAEAGYRLGAWLHRGVYAWGWRRRVRLPCAVVSVGNLAVGGSGKTPLVGWLARELRARGRKLAVLSRGVGGSRTREINVVSDGERVLRSPSEVGDEPVLLAGQLPGVPVLAGRNRAALGLRAVALFGVQVCILDDGFQHHRLVRDLDLVCLDGELGLGNARVLPRGPLREAPAALRRADAIVWMRSAPRPPASARIPPALPQFRAPIAARALRDLVSGARSSPGELAGREVGLLAAIARPDRLEAQLGALGARVIERRVFADHHLYTRAEISQLDRRVSWITTAKDAIKIPPEWTGGVQLAVLEEEVQPEEPQALLELVLARSGGAEPRR